ncbi:MAG: outer membrane protein assembly factor BamE [bacterium]
MKRAIRKGRCFRIGIICFVMCLFFGCLSVGRIFPVDPVCRLQIGTTTKEEVADMFGSPWRTGIENGHATWTYGYYQYKLFGETKTSDLVVRFDEKDRVESYTFNTNLHPEKKCD